MASIMIVPLMSLIAGIVILVFPRSLNYAVAAYLIFFGLVGLLPYLMGGGAMSGMFGS